MHVAAIQYRGEHARWGVHRARLTHLIQAALQRGARVVVAPEMAATGYLFAHHAEAMRFVESAEGAWARQLAELARTFKALIVVGVVTREGDQLYNSAWLFDAEGQLHRYHKRLLYDEDTRWASSGDQEGVLYPVVELDGWRLTLSICMDLNDDRFIEHCHQVQPHLIAFPTNWLNQDSEIAPYWAWRLRGLNAYLIAANNHGEEAHPCREGVVRFRGESAVLLAEPPTLLAQAAVEGDALLEAELIHPDELSFPSHAHAEGRAGRGPA